MTKDAAIIPSHIGFIMDGNRRWAVAHGLKPMEGHKEGHRAAKRVAEACFERGVQFVTLYAFSAENWRRPAIEVSYLMKILAMVVSVREVKYYISQRIRILFMGRRDRIEPALLQAMEYAEAATKDMDRGTLGVCLDYSGQVEIVDAVRRCAEDGLTVARITPEAIEARLYQPDIPDMDLVVRASGEQRISNFMLWRINYSELLFLEKHWPEMTKDDVTDIIEEYGRRSRRFGG
jgi:undecaprenyl diphosphate synthase